MILHVESDSSYLFMPLACSFISGHYYLINHPNKPNNPLYVKPNRRIITKCKTFQRVVGSTAESETGGIFINGQKIVPIWTALIEIYCLKTKTLLKKYNSTSKVYSTRSIRQEQSKSWDIHFCWLRNKDAQKQLNIFWDKFINTNSDYFTKNYQPVHH